MNNPVATLRSVPTQKRSRDTFERILSAASEVLEEYGWDGFNTNLLAERSGHRVAAIYRYFPNKESIVLTLAKRAVEVWGTWFESFDDDLEAKQNFLEVWEQHIDQYYDSIRKMPGGRAIRGAMKASHELQKIDQEDTAELIDKLSNSLLFGFESLSRSETDGIAHLLMHSSVAVLDSAIEAPPKKAQQLLGELKRMHREYLKSCTT